MFMSLGEAPNSRDGSQAMDLSGSGTGGYV
jgi:hypothetical protein